MEQKQKQYPVADVTSARSKIRCFKEQYCIGTWNVRSMNQGKLEVVKQEMARVNVDILGISELKWTGMGSKGNLLQKNLCQHSVASRAIIVSALTPQQATVNLWLCGKLRDTHRQVSLNLD